MKAPSKKKNKKLLDCYWCDVKIKETDETVILPGDRGIAHDKCAQEFYAVKSIT